MALALQNRNSSFVSGGTALQPYVSSSGFRDGLGERDLAFDRETGHVRERLFLRAELSAFEAALRRRLARFALIEDPRLVPIHGVERDPASSKLIVASDHFSGLRLSDIVRTAREREIVPDLTVAILITAEILAGLHSFHAASGQPHGAMSVDRVIVSPAGQIALTDYAYAEALEAAHFSPRRLWGQFGIAHWFGEPFSPAADVRHAVLAAIAVTLGRPIEHEDFPEALSTLLTEVEDAAMIRGGRLFAEPVISWMTRALATGSSVGFDSAEEAGNACAGLLTEREHEVARKALLQILDEIEVKPVEGPDVVEEPEEEEEEQEELEAVIELPSIAAPAPPPEPVAEPEPIYEVAPPREPEIAEPEPILLIEPEIPPVGPRIAAERELEEPELEEPELEEPELEEPEPIAVAQAVPELEPVVARQPEPDPAVLEPVTPEPEPEPVVVASTVTTPDAEPEPEVMPEPLPQPVPEPAPIGSSTPSFVASWPPPPKSVFEADPDFAPPIVSPSPFAPLVVKAPAPPPAPPPAVPAPEPLAPAAAVPYPATAAFVPPVGPVAPPLQAPAAPTPAPRVDPFAPAAAAPYPPPAAPFSPPPPAPFAPAPPPSAAQVAFSPAHVPASQPPPVVPGIAREPIVPAVASGVVAPPIKPAAPSPLAPAGPIKLKNKLAIPKRAPAAPTSRVPDYEPPSPAVPQPDDPAQFQKFWKFVAAGVVLLVVGVAATRVQWISPSEPIAPGILIVETTPTGSEVSIDGKPQGKTPAKLEVEPGTHEVRLSRNGASHSWKVEVVSGARRVERLNWSALQQTGGIEVVTNAPGSRVLVDGQHRGETPLTLTDLSPGRHTVVVEGPSGTVRRTVTVAAGKTAKIDLQIYSGWVVVSSPIELQVAEKGSVIGMAGEGPLVLSAGRHTLELSNKTLDYRATYTVEIQPGEEERLTVRPTGTANINAIPWAEVFVDGSRLGETPLANAEVPLGTREFVFKHPEHGERRVTITVSASEPAQISVDFTIPGP
jgi:hypothetical protein